MHGLVPVCFLAGSVGPGELVLWLAIILLLFGPRRLPGIARQIGKAVAKLQDASRDFRDQVMHMDKEPAATPRKLDTPTAPQSDVATHVPMRRSSPDGDIRRYNSESPSSQATAAPESKPEDRRPDDLAG